MEAKMSVAEAIGPGGRSGLHGAKSHELQWRRGSGVRLQTTRQARTVIAMH